MKRHELRDLINESGLPPLARSVLRHVAERAADGKTGELGEAWPSRSDICHCTGGKTTAVRTALALLRKEGWLVDTGRRRGNGVVVYQITHGRNPPRAECAHPPRRNPPTPRADSAHGRGQGRGHVEEDSPLTPLGGEQQACQEEWSGLNERQRRAATVALELLEQRWPGEPWHLAGPDIDVGALRDGLKRRRIGIDGSVVENHIRGIRLRDVQNGLLLAKVRALEEA